MKHLAKRHGKRNEGDGIHQERNGEDGHGQKTVAFLSRWPMLPASKQAKVSKSPHFDYFSLDDSPWVLY